MVDHARIIGLAGGSCSGKGHLSEALRASLGDDLLVLRLDDYYLDVPDHCAAAIAAHNYDEPAAFDVALLASHLDRLSSDLAIDMPSYDFTLHRRRDGTARVAPRSIVLVEGILVLAIEEIRSRCSLRVFVASPPEVRLERRLHRDVRERGRDEAEVRQRFREHVGAMHDRYVEPSRTYADLVLDGTRDVAENAAEFLRMLA
ncbi:MAG: uridine kinase [Planctomycetes bacterium]|nr:uridine kinase [Planctomycetota bacterium]MCB9917972.1 uridine kinase [Planctomycetota bacterium]